MIVSFKHKFVFVAIPKTAGHAVRAALRPLLADDDWEQCARFEQKRFPVEKLAERKHGHITARQLIPHLETGQWDKMFSFAFVRNPYDRFVSYCAFINRENDKMHNEPRDTMKELLANRWRLLSAWMIPQYKYIVGKNGETIISHVARYENLQSECDAILSKLGGRKTTLPKINASERTHYKDYFDDELIEKVSKLYAKDLELFSYEY